MIRSSRSSSIIESQFRIVGLWLTIDIENGYAEYSLRLWEPYFIFFFFSNFLVRMRLPLKIVFLKKSKWMVSDQI